LAILLVQATDSKIQVRLSADRCGIFRRLQSIPWGRQLTCHVPQLGKLSGPAALLQPGEQRHMYQAYALEIPYA
jgi:hypothetical protein